MKSYQEILLLMRLNLKLIAMNQYDTPEMESH